MPFTWKSRPVQRRPKYGPFRTVWTERWMAPDRLDKVSIKLLGENRTIWERKS